VDLLPCPTNPARLVLAFETQGVVVWDLPDHKVTHKITSESPVHVTAWAPDGLSLAIGRRDGSILVYKVEKHAKVQKSFRPDLDSGNLNVSSVSAIYWLESGMLVLGGKAFGTNQQLTFINGLELNESKGIRVPEKFIPMQLLLTPLPESPETFLVMSEDEVLKFSLPDSRLEYINELFGGSEVLTSQFYTISNHGEELDSVIKTLAKIRKTSILNGGVTDDSEVYGMLITGHSEGIVRFWNVGNSRIAHVFNLCLLSGVKSKFQSNTVFFDISETDPCKVSCLELQSFRLFIGFDMGKVGVWEIQEELTLVNVYKYHKVPVLVVKVIHPFVVSGDMDGQVTFFNCETSDVIFEESEIKKTQKLTVTTVEVINRLVYIGYSNGTLQIFNPFSAVFLPSPKLSKVDLKSEVPKRSETGIFKLLFTSLQSQSVILSYERSMFHCNLSDFSVKASQCWTCPMISCNLAHIRSEVYVYVLHADCVISMLDFFSLARLWKSSLPVPLQ
jgi:WD40 repeat protein